MSFVGYLPLLQGNCICSVLECAFPQKRGFGAND
jgi:hypothetical protein